MLSSAAIAIARRTTRWLIASQMAAALLTVTAGIYLWHTLHADRDGAIEHLLASGTFCAFIGLGLQIGIAAPAFLGGRDTPGKLEGSGLALYRVSVLFLVLAAAAMVASRYGA